MAFIIKKSFNLEIVKIKSFTKIYGQNLRSDHAQFWSRNGIKIILYLPYKIYTW